MVKEAAPRRPTPARRRRRYYHGGAISMVIMASIVAVVVAFVATFVYASIDANRSIDSGQDAAAGADPATPPASANGQETTTTTGPEVLTEDELAKKVNATVRKVQTLDEAGQGVEGSAFVVGTFGGQTLLLTSFAVVRANTKAPGPGITLDGGREATLWSWQEDKDLALLVIGGAIESLPWSTVALKVGEKVYSGGGPKLTAGIVTGIIDGGIEHNIFVEDARQGAPLVNQRGEILGMISRAYNPGGRGTDTQYTAIPIRAACDRVLRCGGGNTAAQGASPTTSTTKP